MMDEGRRFLRYLMPGLVFLTELAALYAVSDWSGTLSRVKAISDAGYDLGAALSLVILSGGLGAVFSQVHHVLHWSLWRKLGFAAHHDLFFKKITHPDVAHAKSHLGVTELRPMQAWATLTSLWHGRVQNSAMIAGANARMTSLSDVAHAAGTALIGSIAAVLTWLCTSDISIASGLIAVGLVTSHLSGYCMTSRMARDTIELTLSRALQNGDEAPLERSYGG